MDNNEVLTFLINLFVAPLIPILVIWIKHKLDIDEYNKIKDECGNCGKNHVEE